MTAVYAYAANHATPAAAEMQIQRIFNMVHGEANCVSALFLLAICQEAGPYDRLYEESTTANMSERDMTSLSLHQQQIYIL